MKDDGSPALYLYFDAQKRLSDFLRAMAEAVKARVN